MLCLAAFLGRSRCRAQEVGGWSIGVHDPRLRLCSSAGLSVGVAGVCTTLRHVRLAMVMHGCELLICMGSECHRAATERSYVSDSTRSVAGLGSYAE